MTNTMTSQNIDVSSWNTLYIILERQDTTSLNTMLYGQIKP
jgi:hypothetical protein